MREPLAGRRMLKRSIPILVLWAAVACDRLHDPVVFNALPHPVIVEARYSDGAVSQGEIAARGVAHLGNPASPPVAIVISYQSAEIARLTASDYPSLLGRPVSGDLVGWKLTTGGVEPLSSRELALATRPDR